MLRGSGRAVFALCHASQSLLVHEVCACGGGVMDFGKLPQFAMLPVADLHVDLTYQRSLESGRSQAAIAKIAAGFRWPLFGTVSVTKGLAGYLIVDGQHRVAAAKRCGIEKVPCLVNDIASVQEQARAFVAANDRVALTGFAIYHAMVAAGDDVALSMARVCAAADVEVARYPMQVRQMQPRQTLSVASIRQAIQRHSERIATAALKAIRQAFPEPGALRAHLIAAIADLVGERHDPAVIAEQIGKIGLKALERKIIDCAADLGVSRVKAAHDVILNLGLTKLPPVPPREKSVLAAKPASLKPFVASPTKAQMMGRRA